MNGPDYLCFVKAFKQLAGQTALYGLPSILGRLLNFLLVPLHTAAMTQQQFGVVTDLYVWVAVCIVLLTYGMETAFFYHGAAPERTDAVFRTALSSLIISTLLFYGLFEWNIGSVGSALRYEGQLGYLRCMVWILCLDVLAALPFARLRLSGKAAHFAAIKFALIGTNILLNLLLFDAVPGIEGARNFLPIAFQKDPVAYVLAANLCASGVMTLLLLPQWRLLFGRWRWDRDQWIRLMSYGLPLMLAGLAGIANELADRQFIKYLLPEHQAMADLGVYGAVYKLSILLMLFVQAYRYAAEPFFFRMNAAGDGKEMNAQILLYYSLFLGGLFIALNAALPWAQHFIDEKFWIGLSAAPVLFAANYVLGLNAHLSIWYKLENKTWYAGVVTGTGLLVTVALNLWLIPKMGWMGAAWATLCAYSAMALLNAVLGTTIARIPYDWPRLAGYFTSAIALGAAAWWWQLQHGMSALIFVLPYLLIILIFERKNWQEWSTPTQ